MVDRRAFTAVTWILAAQLLAALLALALHVTSARILGPDLYGALSFGLTLGALLVLPCALGYPQAMMRYVATYAASGDFAAVKGVCLHSGRSVLGASAGAAAILAGASYWSSATGGELQNGLLIACIVTLFYPVGLLRSKVARGLNCVNASIVPEDILRPLLIVAGLTGLGYTAGSVIGIRQLTLVLLGSMLLSLVVGLAWLLHRLPFPWAGTRARLDPQPWAAASTRVMIGGIFQEVTARSDILALGLLATMSVTAEYSVGARVAVALSLLLKAVDFYYAPRIAVAYQNGGQAAANDVIRSTMLLASAGTAPLVLAVLLAPEVILAVFGPAYAEAATVLQILAVGQLINAATGSVGYGLLMTGGERQFAWITGIVAVMNVIGHGIVTSRYGAVGAAVVTAASIAVQNIAMLMLLRGRARRG